VVTLASHVLLPFSSQISSAIAFHLLLSGSQAIDTLLNAPGYLGQKHEELIHPTFRITPNA